MLDSYLATGDRRIQVHHLQGDQRWAEYTLERLASALPHVSDYFRLQHPLPPIRTVLAPDRREFDRLVRDLLRVETECPSLPSRIAQPQRTDLVLLSPSAYGEHSIFAYIPDDYGRVLAHELVHMVEEHLSPDIESVPRWWGEGLAVYVSQQWQHEEDFHEPVITGLSAATMPSIAEMENRTALAYHWGWTVVWFVERECGRDLILKIVRECVDGDVISALKPRLGHPAKKWNDWLLNHLGELKRLTGWRERQDGQ